MTDFLRPDQMAANLIVLYYELIHEPRRLAQLRLAIDAMPGETRVEQFTEYCMAGFLKAHPCRHSIVNAIQQFVSENKSKKPLDGPEILVYIRRHRLMELHAVH